MRCNTLRKLLLGMSAGFSALVLTSSGWSQEVPAPAVPAVPAAPAVEKDVPAVEKDVKDTAKDAAQDAKEAAKDVRDDAKDAAKDVKDAAKAAPADVRDAARDVRDDARDTVRDTRDAVRDTRDAARDTARDVREGVRDTARDARDTVRDTRDTARDTVRDVRGSVDARAGVNARANLQWQDMQSADLGLWFDRSSRDNLVIADVGTQGPIAKLGFQEGDQIVSVAGQRVTRQPDFMRYLFTSNVRGGRVPVIVTRGGQEQTIYMEPQTFMTHINTSQSDPLEQIGIIPDDRVQDRAVIWKVIPRSPAYFAGLRNADVIVSFNKQPVSNSAELSELAAKAEPGPIAVEVQRGEKARQLEVDFRAPGVQARTSLRPGYDSAAPELAEPAGPPAVTTAPAGGYYNNRSYNGGYNSGRRGFFRRR